MASPPSPGDRPSRERERRRWRDGWKDEDGCRSHDGTFRSPEQLVERLDSVATQPDSRTRFQTDRDRLLYSSALRRLAGVTQVASATEGRVFHNRLTHSLKVAQVARRLAERLLQDPEQEERIGQWGGLDEDVVEAAALAHDLGHPPFGHIAEKELHKICFHEGDLRDGFEGNAQSFRIVTRLEAHREGYGGLDLTRATLNAILKYPHKRSVEDHEKNKKWSVYDADSEAFDFARELMDHDGRSLEAEVMDVADDIAYSVHDLEDFYRAELIPLDRLLHVNVPEASADPHVVEEGGEGREGGEDAPPGPFPQHLALVIEEWKAEREAKGLPYCEYIDDDFRSTVRRALEYVHIEEGYAGTPAHRAGLNAATSWLIDRYISNPMVAEFGSDHPLDLDPRLRLEMKFLQKLVFKYVIENPQLATLQHGQKRIISELWSIYFHALGGRSNKGLDQTVDYDLIPAPFRDAVREVVKRGLPDEGRRQHMARLAADMVAAFSDREAITMYHRLTGATIGSVLDHFDY